MRQAKARHTHYTHHKRKPQKRPLVTRCPYCGGKVTLMTGEELAKRMDERAISRGYVRHEPFIAQYELYYVCDDILGCCSYVSADEKTLKPRGTMANQELRLLRWQAHLIFDEIWKNELMTRTEAYEWLSINLGLPKTLAHISYFDKYNCNRTIQLSKAVLERHEIKYSILKKPNNLAAKSTEIRRSNNNE